ncbi:MAG: substrate-binding domain-containing protein [Solirubrobacteraceae bacterium]
MRGSVRWIAALGATGAVALGAVASAPLGGAAPAAAAPHARTAGKGSVSVLYAGSLEDFMEKDLGPGFEKASGYGFEGFGGGSNELAAAVKGGVRQGDVFVSAAPSADAELQGAGNGGWVSWYSTFATSPLMLGYDPKTKFGRELAKGVPWWKVITQKGIVVGRTEPRLDPKGKLTVEAVDNAARKLKDPALESALEGFPVYPETDLVARLQSGQVDAGFFYAIEAKAASFPTVALKPVDKYAEYTVTLLKGDGDQAGSEALVRYLLSSERSASLKKNGLVAIEPKFHGASSSVPKGIRSLVGG